VGERCAHGRQNSSGRDCNGMLDQQPPMLQCGLHCPRQHTSHYVAKSTRPDRRLSRTCATGL
jgi:hypothetical protein